MPKIFTQHDRLMDVIAFMDVQANPCTEAMDWCRNLGDISMGEFMNVIADNDEYEPSWVAYSVVSFPRLMNDVLMEGFIREMERNPKTLKMVNNTTARKRKSMELVNNG